MIDEDEKLTGNEGTYFFMPPEMLNSETAKKGYSGRAADIWSLGVTFYCFAFMDLPFNGNSMQELFEEIQNKVLEFKGREMSEGFKDVMTKMIQKESKDRATIE